MRLVSKLRYCFGSIVMFSGRLTCSPNTLNNEVHTYMYAYDWQKEYTQCLLEPLLNKSQEQKQKHKQKVANYSYEKWMDLINNVAAFNRFCVQCYKDDLKVKNINIMDWRAFRLFHDWDIWGDSTSYAQIVATAVYDEQKDVPIKKLESKTEKPLYLTSKLGMHKGIMANLDTDSQDMTKYYGFSMIMDEKIKFMPEPFACRDLHFRTVDMLPWTPSMGVDWFASGKVQELYPGSALKVSYPLDQIYKKGESNWLSLRMMQYRYNHPAKVSGVVGHIERVSEKYKLGEKALPQPNNYWRILQLSGEYCNPNPTYKYNTGKNNQTTVQVYLKEVSYGSCKDNKTKGLLLDISSAILDANTTDLLPVLPQKLNLKVQVPNRSKPIEKRFTKDQIQELFLTNAGICLLPLDGQSLPSASLKITIDMEIQSYQVQKQKGGADSIVVPVILSGAQKKATLQIKDRVLKTERKDFRINDGKTRQGTGQQPMFQDFITLDLNLTSFGQKVTTGQNGISTIQLSLSSSFNIDTSGLTQYTTNKDYLGQLNMATIYQRLNNLFANSKTFRDKYTNFEKINSEVYGGRLNDIIEKTDQYLKRLYTPSSPQEKSNGPKLQWKWRNNKNKSCTQEKVYLTFKDEKGNFTKKLPVKFINGRASVNVYLNKPLTDQNNPRWPFLESLCLVGSLTTSLNNTDLNKTFTAIYFQNTAESDKKSPLDYVDWVNVVGPKLKLMGLLYPSMQKIVNLYSYDGMSMSAMKRAFEIQNQNHSRYMPATREMSSITHRQIRQWLYSPTYDAKIQNSPPFPLTKTPKKFQFSAQLITKAIFSMMDQSNRYNKVSNKVKRSYGSQAMDFFYLTNLVKSAFKIEMTTIPLYLGALYSLKQPNGAAGKLIRGVAKDEMKHLFIVSNLANALRITPPYPSSELSVSQIPTYPTTPPVCFKFQLPQNNEWSQLMSDIPVQTCGADQLLRFVIIEMPGQCYEINLTFKLQLPRFQQSQQKHPKTGRTIHQERKHRKERLQSAMSAIKKQFLKNQKEEKNNFLTIGMAYEKIMQLLWKLNDADSELLFNGDPRKQFTYMYLQNMTPIINLRTALEQIRLITEEGEGSNIFTLTGEINKQSHFIKFLQIYLGCDVTIKSEYGFIDKANTCPLNYTRKATFLLTPNQQRFKNFPDYSAHEWTKADDDKVDKLVKEELSVTRFSDDLTHTKFPNTYAPSSFLNTYKKILYDLYYIFTSDPDSQEFREHKNFDQRRLQKMENAIARMRQMTMNADHVVNPNDTYSNTNHVYDSATPKFNFDKTYDPLPQQKQNKDKK